MLIKLLSMFVLLGSFGITTAHAKKKCDCIWMKDAATADFQPGTNLVVWNYEVKSWNEFTIKDRLPECITTCKQHLFDNSATALTKICNNNILYPPVAANSTVKYRLGVRAAVDRPLLNLNIQSSGPYPTTPAVTKKVGQPCTY